ncbi:hypothetical protein NOS3756_28590 [Nostoc sp. NIES-3756]|uniref:PD-(D/E)XK nuclease family protein n=1 Tax=Nostoc sp. NIES-3756 TaxID=1751286 RepID=UPI0007207A2F|nr:PD-(D/E)XK nuclease family protein [Nostoc sp. NIES-3756]BAT53896.1 hypothetical protein NOS3756_28590 [Nostoc sp. NIES-3756]
MSLFKNLLNLHSGVRPVEDFFTEIVAYFLSINTDILLHWLKQHGIINEENYHSINITTQKYYEPLAHHDQGSKPDIVIELANDATTDVIFIESKVGSTEGVDQLKRYAEILSSLTYPQRRILIYITRDYDPKEAEKIISALNVNFHQLRWYQFYNYLTKKSHDILAKEILKFMGVNGMSHTNQISSIDLLTMINFKNTLKFMEDTLSDEVKAKFKGAFKGYVYGKSEMLSDSLYQWEKCSRYIINNRLTPHSGKWDIWCGLGYFNLNPESLTEYPHIGILLDVDLRFAKAERVIEFMQKVINQKPDLWKKYLYDSSKPSTWSTIAYHKSLREFLSQEDHLHSIKAFFFECIEEMQAIQEEFNFPWEVLNK